LATSRQAPSVLLGTTLRWSVSRHRMRARSRLKAETTSRGQRATTSKTATSRTLIGWTGLRRLQSELVLVQVLDRVVVRADSAAGAVAAAAAVVAVGVVDQVGQEPVATADLGKAD
jgi:hypothetical protein